MGEDGRSSSSLVADWRERTAFLLGDVALEALTESHVWVAGVGGVGGHAIEALARAGVGRLTLVDPDEVSLTNLNRQIVALHATRGRLKAEVAKERIAEINPHCQVEARPIWLSEENIEEELLRAKPDYLVDCIDALPAKIDLIIKAVELEIPIISSMGTGGKLDPTQLRIADISRTSVCPLARAVRTGLRKRGLYRGVEVVFSTEPTTPPKVVIGETGKRHLLQGTVSYLPATAGLLLASRVIRQIARQSSLESSLEGGSE
jgi:tRNA A37 threonylcarbamoyladenosine dehydratase